MSWARLVQTKGQAVVEGHERRTVGEIGSDAKLRNRGEVGSRRLRKTGAALTRHTQFIQLLRRNGSSVGQIQKITIDLYVRRKSCYCGGFNAGEPPKRFQLRIANPADGARQFVFGSD